MFEWDETKRLTNIAKHHFDFAVVKDVFDACSVLHFPARTASEERVLSIASINGQFVRRFGLGEATPCGSFR